MATSVALQPDLLQDIAAAPSAAPARLRLDFLDGLRGLAAFYVVIHHSAQLYMTEKAGGSDVGANECTAVRQDDGSWRLYGEKWFCSNPTASPYSSPATS